MIDTPTTYADLEILLSRTTDGDQVELRFSRGDSDAEVSPVRGPAHFDLDQLETLHLDSEGYGTVLTRQLFRDADVKAYYLRARTAVESTDAFLRVRVAVDASAADLHAVRWEFVRDPETRAPLSTSPKTLLSRFVTSSDYRRVAPRPRTEMSALVAIAAPSDLADYRLAEVPRDAEVERAHQALAGIDTSVLDAPVTLVHLNERLREGVDILYIVAHGVLKGGTEPFLFLEDDDGKVARVAGADLAQRVGELERPPRLVVLASCEGAGRSEGTDDTGRPSVLSSLAPRLADAGVPAILAMQGKVTIKTIEKMMPVFFKTLLEDGQLDRALAVARGTVRERHDHWMPALYLRLKGGRLWSDAGFRGRDRVKWRNLCRQVHGGRFVPILGPGVAERLGRPDALARRLAYAHQFPLSEHQKADLPRVLQFIGTKEKKSAVLPEFEEQWKEQVKDSLGFWRHGSTLPDELIARLGRMKLPELLEAVGVYCLQDPDEPHRILAGLPAEIFVTTSYDDLLGRALEDAGRAPLRLICRWRDEPPNAPSPEEEASEARPTVYHLLGSLTDEESLVLTEDDYFDYLITTAANQLIPDDIASVLGDRSLLFIGFRLTDWSFRVLFRLILSFEGRRLKDYPHVAVQVDPAADDFADAEGARDYLKQYFGAAADIDVYWGSAEDFLVQLRDKLGGGDVG